MKRVDFIRTQPRVLRKREVEVEFPLEEKHLLDGTHRKGRERGSGSRKLSHKTCVSSNQS